MKKQFTIPAVEVKSLAPQNEIMGIFSSGNPSSRKAVSTYIVDKNDVSSDDLYSYWQSK